MHKTLRTIGAAGAMLCLSATIVAAQNNSDHIATGIGTSATTGAYTPGNGASPPVNSGTVASESRVLANGSPAQQQVGAVLAGGSTAALGASLTGGGAPAAQTNALMSALGTLASNPSPAALQAAISAYNALVAALPAGAVNNPPPALGAIRGALIQIRAGR